MADAEQTCAVRLVRRGRMRTRPPRVARRREKRGGARASSGEERRAARETMRRRHGAAPGRSECGRPCSCRVRPRTQAWKSVFLIQGTRLCRVPYFPGSALPAARSALVRRWIAGVVIQIRIQRVQLLIDLRIAIQQLQIVDGSGFLRSGRRCAMLHPDCRATAHHQQQRKRAGSHGTKLQFDP